MKPSDLGTVTGEEGCYALWLRLASPRVLAVGRLGAFTFASGIYAYVGSAHGSGGLRARVGRHIRGSSVRHWHVDALRAASTVVDVWLWPGAPRSDECRLAAALASAPDVGLPVPGFGSSDCGCPGHLIGPFSAVPAFRTVAGHSRPA